MRNWPVLFSLILSSFFGFGQKLEKDTLYFKYEPDYILDADNFQNRDRFILQVFKLQQKSDYEGYIYLLKDTIIAGPKPKDILSLKETIENDEYYYDGQHNRLVNRSKLKTKLLDNYQILFIKNDSLIVPKRVQYNTYYPRGKGESYIDRRVKDTLVFQFDKKRWSTSFSPDGGALVFTLIDKKLNGELYFEIREKITEEEFETLNVSNEAHIEDVEVYLARQKGDTKGIQNNTDNYELWDYFNYYEVYIRSDQVVYHIEPLLYQD